MLLSLVCLQLPDGQALWMWPELRLALLAAGFWLVRMKVSLPVRVAAYALWCEELAFSSMTGWSPGLGFADDTTPWRIVLWALAVASAVYLGLGLPLSERWLPLKGRWLRRFLAGAAICGLAQSGPWWLWLRLQIVLLQQRYGYAGGLGCVQPAPEVQFAEQIDAAISLAGAVGGAVGLYWLLAHALDGVPVLQELGFYTRVAWRSMRRNSIRCGASIKYFFRSEPLCPVNRD